MIRREPDRNVIDLRFEEDKNKIKESKMRIILATIFIISFFLLYWTLFYNVKKPYDFFDFITKNFVYKSLFMIFLFGVVLYIWCPFGTCYNYINTSTIRKNLPLAIKKDFCCP